jgi:hypothetical protein
VKIVEISRANCAATLCVSPQSLRKIQPLDVSFMSPFKTYCEPGRSLATD